MKDKITLWLDTKQEPYVLEIHNSGRVEVKKESKAQNIVWQLTGPVAKGQFVPMTDTAPGFEWVPSVPAPGIFGEPTIEPNKQNELSITDNHTSDTSDGEWEYILRVKYNTKIYEIKASIGRPLTPTSPIIINR